MSEITIKRPISIKIDTVETDSFAIVGFPCEQESWRAVVRCFPPTTRASATRQVCLSKIDRLGYNQIIFTTFLRVSIIFK